jgi:hypothetical protein
MIQWCDRGVPSQRATLPLSCYKKRFHILINLRSTTGKVLSEIEPFTTCIQRQSISQRTHGEYNNINMGAHRSAQCGDIVLHQQKARVLSWTMNVQR